jgi:hypothetical protein
MPAVVLGVSDEITVVVLVGATRGMLADLIDAGVDTGGGGGFIINASVPLSSSSDDKWSAVLAKVTCFSCDGVGFFFV